MHHRLEGAEHQFTYPVYFYRFDVDELPELARSVPAFGYNRWNLISIFDADYLERGFGSLRQKAEVQLFKAGIQEKPARIELVTCARYFGYVFNPVSFFYCYGETGEIFAVLAQVNNTFGESHLYVLRDPVSTAAGRLTFRTQKVFHVSPFFDRRGEYSFVFYNQPESVHISVNLFKEGRPAILTDWKGKAVSFTSGNLFSVLGKFPLSIFLTVPRIHLHAAKLYFQKKRLVFSKPAPVHPMTIRKARPTLRENLSCAVIFHFLKKIKKGKLVIENPDGQTVVFGGELQGPEEKIKVQDWRFYWRLVKDSGIGLGEGFMAGDWDSPDVTGVLRLMIQNKEFVEKRPVFMKGFGDFFNRLSHLRRNNSLGNSKKNIQDHYDLGNDFFQLFLDPSMMYSCGIFHSSEESLQKSQENKIDRMIEKAEIRAEHHVLEIGSGWGGLAIRAVQKTGCRVTSITLSEEQLKMARQRAEAAGLSDRIEFKICDYRTLEGKFDRIVSVEMLEAVGHEYLGDYFKACARLLKPEGRAAIQVITIPHERYESYRTGCDFIQKHIFPGGHLPSREILSEAAKAYGRFQMTEVDDIGPHYAPTLRMWREAFAAKSREMDVLNLPLSMRRAWLYYFHYCEAGFAERYIHDLQFVLVPLNSNTKTEEAENGNNRSAGTPAVCR